MASPQKTIPSKFSKQIFQSAKAAEKAALKAISALAKKLKTATKTLNQTNKKILSAQKKFEKTQLKLEAKMTLTNKKAFTAAKNALKKLEKAAQKALVVESKTQAELETCQLQISSTFELIEAINLFQKTSEKPAKAKKTTKVA